MRTPYNPIAFWKNLKISAKFSIGFGLLLFLIFTVAAGGYFTLRYVHRAETTIENNLEVKQLILAMDRNLQRAKRLHSDFFLNYPQIGIQQAHERYAQESIQEAAQTIALSAKLQKLLNRLQVSSVRSEHNVNLSLYLSSAKRFAETSILSFELITDLATPGKGLQDQLTSSLDSLKPLLSGSPELNRLLEEMKASVRRYYSTKQRSIMQTVSNKATQILENVVTDPAINETTQQKINMVLTHITSTVARMVSIDEHIKSVFKDFALQEANLASTAETLLALADKEVERARKKINDTREITLQVNILLFLSGFGIALGIIWLLHKSITTRVLQLTRTAELLREGDLNVTFEDNSRDELGTLAHVFTAMTSQRSEDIKQLHRANQDLIKAQDFLEATVTERTNELRQLLELSSSLTKTPDSSSLYRQCTSLGKELLKFDFSTLMLLNPDGKGFSVNDTIGFPEHTIGTFPLEGNQGLSNYVLKLKKPVAVVDFTTETRFEVPSVIFKKKITSGLCTPMMIRDMVFGVIIGHTRKKRIFSESEISLFQSFGNQAAVAIDNALHIAELENSEKKFRTFFDNANDAIIVFELEGRLLEANQVAMDSLGYTRNTLLELQISDLIAPDFLPDLSVHIKEIISTGKQIFESAQKDSEGKIIPVELSCTFFEFNETPAILAVARDISERKIMEQELIKIERLESIGVLAGGIAHDFNNILASILGNINLARLDMGISKETQTLLKEAENASMRARGLTQQLLTFARGGDPVKEVCTVTDIIRDCSDFVLRGSNVSCQYQCHDDLWLVEIDKNQISQVIQNLIINARHAMPDGGEIVVHCRNRLNPQEINSAADTERFIEITIDDCGVGIPDHIIDKIFDPYFTTKQEGSGLGLAVSHSIITKHGGFLLAESTPGTGSTFTVYLPASAASQIPLTDPEESKYEPEAGSARVMIMDDDPMIIQVTRAMLEQLGYDVVTAVDGEEAIRIYQKSLDSGQEIDVTIMDLTIPGGMGGKEAVKEILAIHPAAKVMVSSGYSNDPVMAGFQEYGFQAAVCKPFQLQDLKRAIDQLLKS